MDVKLPLLFLERKQSPPTSTVEAIEDCAFDDLDDDVEFVTHHPGKHGSFSKADRLHTIRTTLFEQANELSGLILENMACVYQYQYPDVLNGQLKKQAGVGIIVKVYGGPGSEDAKL